MHLRCDPTFDIGSPNWDSFSRWELRPDRRAGYLGDADWDPNWVPVMSSSNDEDDDDEDEEDDNDDRVPVQPPPPPSPPRVSAEVSGQIYNGRVIRDDMDDMVNHVVYHYFQAADRGKAFELPSELTKEEELAVAVLISQEEERRAFPELADALALSVVPPPSPGPPRTPPARPRREARAEPWDAWPGAALGWPTGAPPIMGWAPGTPTPLPGPPPPLIANWPWSQGPFIDLSGDDDDE
jgi:hypothetical protein